MTIFTDISHQPRGCHVIGGGGDACQRARKDSAPLCGRGCTGPTCRVSGSGVPGLSTPVATLDGPDFRPPSLPFQPLLQEPSPRGLPTVVLGPGVRPVVASRA